MEDLVISLRNAPSGDPARNSTIGMLAKLWQPFVDEWMARQDAAFLREHAVSLAAKAIALSAAYAGARTKKAKTEVRSYVERSQFKGRQGDIRRGSCIAWINSLLPEGHFLKESRKELPWTYAVKIINWLNGDHPDHQEWSEEQVAAALAERRSLILGFLSWETDKVWEWEAKSKQRRGANEPELPATASSST